MLTPTTPRSVIHHYVARASVLEPLESRRLLTSFLPTDDLPVATGSAAADEFGVTGAGNDQVNGGAVPLTHEEPPPPGTPPPPPPPPTLNSDTVLGTAGDDRISVTISNGVLAVTVNDGIAQAFAGLGELFVDAGSGNDLVLVDPAVTTRMLVTGSGGNDTIVGGSGHDELSGANGKDRVFGGLGSDYLLGGAAADYLLGGGGDDLCSGGGGKDRIFGDGGSDYLLGGAGNDYLDSVFVDAGLADGTDTVSGNLGNDSAVTDLPDVVAGVENLQGAGAAARAADGSIRAAILGEPGATVHGELFAGGPGELVISTPKVWVYGSGGGFMDGAGNPLMLPTQFSWAPGVYRWEGNDQSGSPTSSGPYFPRTAADWAVGNTAPRDFMGFPSWPNAQQQPGWSGPVTRDVTGTIPASSYTLKLALPPGWYFVVNYVYVHPVGQTTPGYWATDYSFAPDGGYWAQVT